MIGLVIVSHSARLAEGVVELAREMGGADVPIAVAGGLDLPDHPLGTDAALVLRAILQVYSEDGVVVLMDLGSAILSAEMALDLLDPAQRGNVRLCEAPLVEGAVVAAVQIRLGSSMAQVIAEARGGLSAKVTHLRQITLAQPAQPENTWPTSESDPASVETLRLIVKNRQGLHLRPSARLVETVGRFSAEVYLRDLTTGSGPVSARSINAVTTLGVRQGDSIEVSASGLDRLAALEAIHELGNSNFGDLAGRLDEQPITEPGLPEQPENGAARVFSGQVGSPGLAFGPVRHFEVAPLSFSEQPAGLPDSEWDTLNGAIEKTRAALEAAIHSVGQKSGASAADIFVAHRLCLEDSALLEPARQAIFEDRLSAAAAWDRAINAMISHYETLADPYLRARSADIGDVGQQVLRNMPGVAIQTSRALTEPGILIADDLTPADVATLDPALVRGIALAKGGPTAHSVILARSMGIPVVVGAGTQLLTLDEGTPLILEGNFGQLIASPSPEQMRDYAARVAQQNIVRAETLATRGALAITPAGRRIEIAANISSLADASAAIASGAEGIGVFRTEFLFLDRQTAPDEDEQFIAYRDAAAMLAGRPLIVRTLDVGGDKPLPYIDQGREANPYLGWRGIRLCLAQPDLFKVQLRAIARTAVVFQTAKVMFPMIAVLDEVRAAKRLLAEACAEITIRTGHSVPRIETGIMVEVPSSALLAEQFAPEVDFLSIGTNDLTQYTMAAERGNPRVAALSDAAHPAVLRLIAQVIGAGHKYGKWVGVCGELASDPMLVPLLICLGVDELSMTATAIPLIKQIVRTLDEKALTETIPGLLALDSAQAVRTRLQELVS